MSTEIVLTGTGYPRPHPERAGPGVLVRHEDTVLQFDAGRGTVMRLAALGVTCQQVDAVLVTHHHSDHLVALPDMALTRWIARDPGTGDSPLEVVVPEGPSARFVERMLEPWEDDIAVRVEQTGRASRPELRCRAFPAPQGEAEEVWVKGPGSGREASVRALQGAGLDVVAIRDVTPIPHNGCRAPKRRRV